MHPNIGHFLNYVNQLINCRAITKLHIEFTTYDLNDVTDAEKHQQLLVTAGNATLGMDTPH